MAETLKKLIAETKPKRPMSIKRFISATPSAKIKVEDYLESHRQFLLNYEFLHPLVEAYERKEILPSPFLESCKALLFQFSFAIDTAKAEATLEKNLEDFENKPRDANGNVINNSIPSGNYLVSLMVKVFDKEGNCTIELGTVVANKVRIIENDAKEEVEQKYTETSVAIWACDTYGEAERLADRRLVGREDSVYAVIENQTSDEKVITNIPRADSFARYFKRKKQPFMKQAAKTTKRLGFGVKAKNSRSIGPWSILR